MVNKRNKKIAIAAAVVLVALLVLSLYMAFRGNNKTTGTEPTTIATNQYYGLDNLLRVGVSDSSVTYLKNNVARFMAKQNIPVATPVYVGGVTHKHFTDQNYDTYNFTVLIDKVSYYANLKTSMLQPTELQLLNETTNQLIYSSNTKE